MKIHIKPDPGFLAHPYAVRGYLLGLRRLAGSIVGDERNRVIVRGSKS